MFTGSVIQKMNQKKNGYIQRKFAYGIESKALANDQFELRFVSHKITVIPDEI